MLYSFCRRFLFCLDPELGHALATAWLKLRFSSANLIENNRAKMPTIPSDLAGIPLPNPVGLAGGFDKNADYIDELFALGFGFIEVGTVTPQPQPGNPKPRLFRLPQAEALINRMGFNNKGVDHLVSNLKKRKVPGIVGVNIGKNKDTPLEQADKDYCSCLKAVYRYADYIAVNISSPNTPGLRQLHGEKYLNDLLKAIQNQRIKLETKYKRRIPILVKISVDIPNDELKFIVNSVKQHGFNGMITSNTTVCRDDIKTLPLAKESGGLSGAPLTERAQLQTALLRKIAGNDFTLIGVGGVMNSHDAKARLSSGANLLQIYTGFVYQGPGIVKALLLSLQNGDGFR